MVLGHEVASLTWPSVQRLVNNAEEVAFNDPPGGTAEKLILNRHLSHMLKHARLSALQRFFQQVPTACRVLARVAACSPKRQGFVSWRILRVTHRPCPRKPHPASWISRCHFSGSAS